MKVVHLADVKNDNRLMTPVSLLRQVADEIETGERTVKERCIVVLVNDADSADGTSNFCIAWSLANIPCSRAIAALECVKADLLASMGYGQSNG